MVAARRHTHDDAGRLSQVSAGILSTRSETFTLDANGNRTSHSQTGSTLWQYDAAGRLTQRPSASGSGTTNYQYDASGNLTEKADTSRIPATGCSVLHGRLVPLLPGCQGLDAAVWIQVSGVRYRQAGRLCAAAYR